MDDLVITGGIQLIRLGLDDMQTIVHTAQQFHLDFDDAYQYVASRKHDLTLVSFDKDFDRTDAKRKSPAEVIRR